MLNEALRKHPLVLPLTFLLLVILLPYWKLTTMQGVIITDDIFTSDIMNEGFPYRHAIGEALKSGEAPVWLPAIYGGMPLLARAEAGVCYPFNLLLFGLLPPYTALNISILLTLVVAAVGMYFYVREVGAGIAGALIAGVSFAYSGFMVSHMKHLSMVGTVCWFPLGLLLLERALAPDPARTMRTRIRLLLTFGLVLGLQNLSGHIQTAYYSALVYFLYAGFRLFSLHKTEGKKGGRKRQKVELPAAHQSNRPVLLWFVAALILGAGLSAVQVLPTYELVGLTQRAEGVTFDYAAQYAYDPANITTFVYPYANGDAGNATYTGKSVFWEDYGYAGLIVLLLAVFAAIRMWRSWHVKFFAAAAIGAYLLVLGPNTPIYEAVFHIVPGMKYFRFPTRFLFVVDASLAVLAALGASALLKGRTRDEGKSQLTPALSPAGLVILGLVTMDLLYFQMRQNPVVDAEKWREPPSTAVRLQNDPEFFRIYSPGASDIHKRVYGAARGWQGDLQPYIDHREFLQVSSNVLYGLASADGYAQLTPNSVVDVWGDQNRPGVILQTASLQGNLFVPKPSFLRIMNLFNVKYILSPWPIVTDALPEAEVIGPVRLYRNPGVMPRAFVVGGYRVAGSPEEARAMLLSESFDPAREALLYRSPGIEASSSGVRARATVEHYGTNEVIVNVSTEATALLILSDTYYPGWRAEVDGRETEILQANLCQRAVVVPAGEHSVRFTFASSSIRLGLGITFLSLMAYAGLMLVAGKRNS